MSVPLPPAETERLKELHEYDVLDTLPEQAYDDITYLASQICGSEIALVSLVDGERQWFKSRLGLDATETPRDLAFCAHAILEPEQLLVVPDATADDRFATNPLVTSDPSIRFYAGAPLVTANGHALGTLCVIDRHPRQLDADQEQALRALSRQVMAQLELRRSVSELRLRAEQQRAYERQLEEYQRKLESSFEAMAEDSVTDPLTGCRNRRALLERLDEEFERAVRYRGDLSLAIVDVDLFKDYNDALGHPAGDEALRQVVALLEECSRNTDLVARYGGEEFAIILPNTDSDGAYVMAERFRKSVEWHDWPQRPVTVSVGVATVAPDMVGANALLEATDKALYRAKEAGRNRVMSA